VDSHYLNCLEPDTRNLVAEIEQSGGVEIEVTVDPSRALGKSGRAVPLACQVENNNARILIPRADYFPDASVVHELLHIQRFLSVGVPRIIVAETFKGWTPELDNAMTNRDNSLEHLVIVPEEFRRRPNRIEHWDQVMRRTLDGIPAAPLSQSDRDGLALMNYVFVAHVIPRESLHEKARRLVEGLGLVDRASRFKAMLIPALGSKENAVVQCFEHLQLPVEMASLEYLESGQRTRGEEKPLREIIRGLALPSNGG
jgi:hypothetical protein